VKELARDAKEAKSREGKADKPARTAQPAGATVAESGPGNATSALQRAQDAYERGRRS
jgi:hypothetical protein